MALLKGLRVAVLAADGFERAELREPERALSEAGASVRILGFGRVAEAPIDECRSEEFDALLIPGGKKAVSILRENFHALEFLKQMQLAGKPIGMIGEGVELAVHAHIIEGRVVAAAAALGEEIEKSGGRWVDTQVMVNGNWVSARRPADLPEFNREFISLICRLAALEPIEDLKKEVA